MKIKFTLTLSKATVRAFKEAEDCATGNDIKDALVECLQEKLDEVRESAGADDEEEEDDE